MTQQADEEFQTMFEELLAAAETASQELHQQHSQRYHIPIGRGICEWKPCQALFKAIANASQERWL